MSKVISLQAGQWYRDGHGDIVYCIGFSPSTAGVSAQYPWVCCTKTKEIVNYTVRGKFDQLNECKKDIVEHLPGCDGFNWEPPKPKLQLREGAWYKRKDGKIVGPCEPCDVSITALTGGKARWRIGCLWYGDDGTCPVESNWLLHEVDAPKPKYRPFTWNEFAPHRDKWIVDAQDVRYRVGSYCNQEVQIIGIGGGVSYRTLFIDFRFEDGSMIGVEVTE